MEIILTISKEDVMHEVAVSTAYTGSKMDNDKNALHRISTVDEDENQLERFWEESRSDLCQELIGVVSFEGMVKTAIMSKIAGDVHIGETGDASVTERGPHYELRLEVSKSFDRALLPSMKLSLYSYFVHSIVAKWYVYTNKGEAGDYADKASTLLDDIHRKAVYKKKPTRPVYDD